jgi:hypothetical protein
MHDVGYGQFMDSVVTYLVFDPRRGTATLREYIIVYIVNGSTHWVCGFKNVTPSSINGMQCLSLCILKNMYW